MALINKPDYSEIWASGGSTIEPSDVKKQTGWTAEVPPYQWENWIQNRQDQFIAHVNQRGIPQWDGQTEYEPGGLSYVQGIDGIVYKSVAASGPSTTSQDPTTDVSDTYWTVAFAGVGAFLTEAAGDTRYLQRNNNLNDLSNAVTARDNLSVYSKAFIDALNINTVPIDIASASTVNLTVLAPNTRHINITGTTAITGFTVAAGQCYFVRFADTLTLTNGAGLVTNRGSDITTADGDTCIIRATSENTVEVLCGDFLSEAAVGTRGQTWQDVSGSRVVATNYTNTTGRPIMVSVTKFTSGSTQATVTLSVDGVVASSGYHSGQARATLCAIVPPGGVYRVDGGESTNNWAELR